MAKKKKKKKAMEKAVEKAVRRVMKEKTSDKEVDEAKDKETGGAKKTPAKKPVYTNRTDKLSDYIFNGSSIALLVAIGGAIGWLVFAVLKAMVPTTSKFWYGLVSFLFVVAIIAMIGGGIVWILGYFSGLGVSIKERIQEKRDGKRYDLQKKKDKHDRELEQKLKEVQKIRSVKKK